MKAPNQKHENDELQPKESVGVDSCTRYNLLDVAGLFDVLVQMDLVLKNARKQRSISDISQNGSLK